MALRLGDIAFLNSWPVTYALRRGLIPWEGGWVLGTPTQLNCRLLTGELDASAVSSFLYLKHTAEWVPVPGLCIRSDGGVKSVLVVSRRPLKELKGKTIAVSNQGATTPVLLKLLLKRENLRLNMQVSSLRYPEILKEHPAALLIGDEALYASQAQEGFITWDLAEAWTKWTRLPFVFALWVVRRPLVEKDPAVLTQLSEALHASWEWAKMHPKELVASMRAVFPWEATFLMRYLAGLSYELDEWAWKGLTRFAWEAHKIGELRRIMPVPTYPSAPQLTPVSR